jgi:anti-sigma factor RsiW
MSHLGDRLSALVDGELDGAELDRAHAHLAGCERCRAEAAELRALKQKLRELMTGAPAEAAMTRRLIAMTGPGGPLPPQRRLLRVVPGRPSGVGPAPSGPTPSGPTPSGPAPSRSAPSRSAPSGPAPSGPAPSARAGRRSRSARRRRYLVLGTVSLVVGLGAAAFTAGGGGDASPGPRITPPVEMYSVEHAITTGEVPFPGPTAQPASSGLDSDAPPP